MAVWYWKIVYSLYFTHDGFYIGGAADGHGVFPSMTCYVCMLIKMNSARLGADFCRLGP